MVRFCQPVLVRLRALPGDHGGAALVEFALIAPALMMLLFGTLEFGLNVYLRAVAEGAMQQAGRASSLQSAQADQSTIDDQVRRQIQTLLPGATVTFERHNYAAFSKVNKPEDFIDANANGVYDSGECFLDSNGNNLWDADGGRNGIGGANDVVEYTATISYTSWIPGKAVLGLSPTTRVKAKTLLRNQPFATEPGWSARQVCPTP